MKYAHITGWGKYVPPKVVTNDDLSKIMDTSDEWIRSRTGIGERHYVEDETLSQIAAKAALEALDCSGVSPSRVDLIIVCTCTAKVAFPATACLVQDMIGATNAGAFDLVNACAGFIYGVAVASDMIKSGARTCALVIGAEVLSRFIDFSDRGTAVLFGDGAGAVVIQGSDQPGGVLAYALHSDGSGADALYLDQKQKVQMNGREVFKFATRVMVSGAREVMAKAGWRTAQVDYFVPHQANARIIETASKGLALPLEKFFMNIEKYGNTSAASIPIALTEAVDQGLLRPNDKVVMVGFGGGLAWGALAMTWDVPSPTSRIGRWYNRLGYNTSRSRQRVRRGFRSALDRLRRRKASDDHGV